MDKNIRSGRKPLSQKSFAKHPTAEGAKTVEIQLDDYLNTRIDQALEAVNQRNPELNWTKEQIIRLTIGHGLNHLFRQQVRWKVHLQGTYRKLLIDYPGKAVMITDISRSGVGFLLLEPGGVRLNEILDLEFIIGKAHQSLVAKRVIVRHVTGEQVGAEFCELSDLEFMPPVDEEDIFEIIPD
jgi:hypothetical protein